jgi:uncharacterized protein
MHPLLDAKHEEIVSLCRRYGVRQLEVFGSAAQGNDFDPARSDADFLVEFRPEAGYSALKEFFGFQSALSQLLQRPVDLAERGAIRNPYVLAGIERSREVVYVA